jgi:SAM-dependent methyltransferase
MSLGHALLRQCRKPSGRLGRMILWSMNRRHAAVTAWGLRQVPIGSHDVILDVGCGGGATIARLAALATDGKVHGVDYSEESVAAARHANRQSSEAGRVEIRCASVSSLPFPDGTFDLVTAVETHYYWPDLAADAKEVLRVLAPGGTVLIIAEAYKGGKYDRMLQRLEALQRMGIMKYSLLTVAEHRALLTDAGCADVRVVEEYERGWICALGRKPGSPEPKPETTRTERESR